MIAIAFGALMAAMTGPLLAGLGFSPITSLAVALASSSTGALALGLVIASRRQEPISETPPRVGIVAGLHALYDGVLDEPLPDHLQRLLAGLGERSATA